MIKLFYNPISKSIIGKKRGKFYNLPICQEIDKPKNYYPCKEFTKKNSSKVVNHLKIEEEILNSGFFYIKKCRITIHLLNGKYYYLTGFLPKYVLDGIINLINYV